MPMGFVVAHASQHQISARREESIAFRRPKLGLEGLRRPEHARRPIEIAAKSLGNTPGDRAGPRARASRVHRDPWLPVVSARLLHRPPNVALQLAGAESIAVVRLDSILKGNLLSAWTADRPQLSSALAGAKDFLLDSCRGVSHGVESTRELVRSADCASRGSLGGERHRLHRNSDRDHAARVGGIHGHVFHCRARTSPPTCILRTTSGAARCVAVAPIRNSTRQLTGAEAVKRSKEARCARYLSDSLAA